jgi:DNA-binding response OmpR family regulator
MGVMEQHPLLVDRHNDIPLYKRPRFTPTEILVLNALVNNAPYPITTTALVRVLRQLNTGFIPTEGTIRSAIRTIRAKLGEERYKPVRIGTLYHCVGPDRETGYIYRDQNDGVPAE